MERSEERVMHFCSMGLLHILSLVREMAVGRVVGESWLFNSWMPAVGTQP